MTFKVYKGELEPVEGGDKLTVQLKPLKVLHKDKAHEGKSLVEDSKGTRYLADDESLKSSKTVQGFPPRGKKVAKKGEPKGEKKSA